LSVLRKIFDAEAKLLADFDARFQDEILDRGKKSKKILILLSKIFSITLSDT